VLLKALERNYLTGGHIPARFLTISDTIYARARVNVIPPDLVAAVREGLRLRNAVVRRIEPWLHARWQLRRIACRLCNRATGPGMTLNEMSETEHY
jgi:hypothetical protein